MGEWKQALRQLRRAPGFTAVVVLTLALAIGVNTAVFSVLDGFLLRALPYPEPDRIAALMTHVEHDGGGALAMDRGNHDGATWVALQDHVDAAILAAWGGTDGVNLDAGSGSGHAVRYVHETRVSARYFEALGTPLYRGRGFTDAEDRPHGPRAVVLSYGLWRTTFNSDPGLLGATITLKGEPYAVVGILAANAATPSHADLFTALEPAPTGECGGTNCGILLRLQPGARWQQVAAELSAMPRPDSLGPTAHAWYFAEPLQRYLGGDMGERAEALMLAVGLILLIACGNLAGLALVRLGRRAPELATRMALGASRARLLSQLWRESLLLAVLGAAVGLALAALLLRGIASLLDPAMIPLGGFELDARVLAFAVAAAAGTSVLFGLLPALQTRRLDLRSSLAAGTRAVAMGGGRTRQALIAVEVALTVVLLAGAGLLVRTLAHLETLPPGFDPQGVLTAKASLADVRYSQTASFQTLLQRSVDAMQRIPGVEAAGVGLSLPYESPLNDGIVIADGPRAGFATACSLSYATPGYFAALRIPLLAGRSFTASDTAASTPVALVNAALGPRFYGEALPLGRHFREGSTTYTIVGVVAAVPDQSNVSRSAPLGNEPMFYVPATQVSGPFLAMANLWFQPVWVVRSGGRISGLAAAMQRALGEADPDLPFSGFSSIQAILDQQLRLQRVEVTLLGTLAGLALLLSALGTYALVAALVTQRTRELGIRLALGSTLGRAMTTVAGGGLMAAAVGTLVGLGMCRLALPVLASEIYGVSTFDPVTLMLVPALLLAVAAAASWLPALRIARIDPAATLRSD